MAAHGPNRKIVDVEHKRLTDEGAKHSKGLEMLCYLALLAKPRIAPYLTSVFDGCRKLQARGSASRDMHVTR
eukprot:1018332-Prymnesium_polylepis.1